MTNPPSPNEALREARHIYWQYMEDIAAAKGAEMAEGQKEKCLAGDMDDQHGIQIALRALASPSPASSPLEGEVREAIERSRATAMEYAVKARIPECGKFGEIAQDLDAALSALSTEAGKPAPSEPVAWMYEKGDRTCLWRERAEPGEMCHTPGWAETPLYAAPVEPAPSEERLREAASIIEQFVKYLGDDPWHMVGKARDFLAGISTPLSHDAEGESATVSREGRND